MPDRSGSQPVSAALNQITTETCSDEELVLRILAGERDLFGVIMRRYATRLYRLALSVLRDPSEAEDVVQEAFIRSYQHLGQFAGRARFATWLSRIAVHEALARRHRNARFTPLDPEPGEWKPSEYLRSPAENPEQNAQRRQMMLLAASVIRLLPEHYRRVLFLRDIRDLDVSETARRLGLSKENVKVRLHRAHAVVRRAMLAQMARQPGTAVAM